MLRVGRLGLPCDLAPHLAAAGALRVTFMHALEAGRASPEGLGAVQAGLPSAVSRMRRLVGAAGPARLAQRLGAGPDLVTNKQDRDRALRAESAARSQRE